MSIRALVLRLLSLSLVALISCQGSSQPSTVFCASSMAEVSHELNRQRNLKLRIHSAGSNTLIRQLSSGIRADLIILADPKLAEELPEAQTWKLRTIASNRLVLVCSPSRSELSLREVQSDPSLKLAIADPVSAPLGRYSSQAQKKLGIPARALLFRNASETINAVSQGHADIGIVYQSDLKSASLVRSVSIISTENHATIQYVACLAPEASTAATSFFDELNTEESQQLLQDAGFLIGD